MSKYVFFVILIIGMGCKNTKTVTGSPLGGWGHEL